MDMQDFANLGAAVLTGNPIYVGSLDKQALHARNQSNEMRRLLAYAVPTADNLQTRIDGPIIGWTTPSLTYDKMRQINGSALVLNFEIEKNVTGKEFKRAWDDWFKTWQTFFDRNQHWTTTLGVVLSMDTDLLAAQTESFRIQLVGDKASGEPGWMAKYEAESTPDHPFGPSSAAVVPKVVVVPPGTPPTDPADPMPWWLIALFVAGGVGVVAGSFFIIRKKVIESEQAAKFIRHDVLPIVLGSTMGPTGVAFAHAANNRFAGPTNDPSGLGGPTPAGYEGYEGR